MGTETLRLLSTAASQLLRTKASLTKSGELIERGRPLIKRSMVRCGRIKPAQKARAKKKPKRNLDFAERFAKTGLISGLDAPQTRRYSSVGG
jgi:hypothetical protein